MKNFINQTGISHFPVLLNEVIEICGFQKGKDFLDCTFGGGGYSESILKMPNTNVSAIDRDESVSKFALNLKKKFPNRFNFRIEKFSNIIRIFGDKKFDFIIFDLGVSSYQLNNMSRGFSFKSKENLNMSMGLNEITAFDAINNLNENELKLIIKIFGEEKESNRIARNIIKKRKIKKISTAEELKDIIESSKKKNFKKKINVSTKTFQAFRIFVNKEISELTQGITQATQILKPGGKLIVISFHSIEDKIIKFFFKNFSSSKSKKSRYFPDQKKNITYFEDYKNKVIKAKSLEISKNPPSRSAKLRFAIRNDEIFKNSNELFEKFKSYIELEMTNV